MNGKTFFQKSLKGLLRGGLLGFAMPALAVAQADDAVVYAKDVAPIIQENCQVCHRTGSVAPMSLLTYEDAKSWAPMIKDQVSKRIMPPWPLDTEVGIQSFKNDRSLSKEEIETIVRWVDSGALRGDPADEPPPIAWPAWGDKWAYENEFDRPPDVVITSPRYTVKADGMDQWPNLPPTEVTSEMGVTGERWIRAVELRPIDPQSASVFHPRLRSRGESGARRSVSGPRNPRREGESRSDSGSCGRRAGIYLPRGYGVGYSRKETSSLSTRIFTRRSSRKMRRESPFR